jgi:drug/metabolite transporter (DMT)-like permease
MKGINTDWDKPICFYLWQLIMKSKPSYPLAILEAVFVNIIWASSFIFVKLLLKNLGPLTIGGLRYFIGFLVLLPFMLRKGRLDALPRRMWLRLLLIGLSAYTIGNGAMFWSLKYLRPLPSLS